MNRQFLTTDFQNSIKNPHFFNGRILTATDLRDEQTAGLKRSRYLGQAIGEGIAYGLTVAADGNNPRLRVTSGLAIDRRGDGLYLGEDITLELVGTKAASLSLSPFAPCEPDTVTTLTGVVSTGYYLLVITCVARYSTAMAPNSSLGGDKPGCTHRYAEVGVQFALIALTNDDFVSSIAPTAPNSRSRLAHVCLGTDQWLANLTQPLTQPAQYGLVDALRVNGKLSDCDVPLAVLHWQGSALSFLDMWAVRRPTGSDLHPLIYASVQANWSIPEAFAPFLSPRRGVEMAAFWLQFQNHLEDLRTDSSITPSQAIAATYFNYLPAVGYLPIQSSPASASDRAFNSTVFFGATIPVQTIPPNQLRSLFHDSFYSEPIRPGIEAIDLYTIAGSAPAAPYRLFARRSPVTLPEPPAPTPTPQPEPTPQATGDLYVTVLSEEGNTVPDAQIRQVQATSRSGQVYTAQGRTTSRIQNNKFRETRFQLFQTKAKSSTQSKYSNIITDSTTTNLINFENVAIWAGKPLVYVFDDLPVGTYSVQAIPSAILTFGVASEVQVRANIDNFASVTIRRYKIKTPDNVGIKLFKKFTTPKNILIDEILVNLEWRNLYPNWEQDLNLNRGNIDPAPEEWTRFNDPRLGISLEETFAGIEQPGLVTEGGVLYVRNGYNPSQVSDTITAFVQTPDGSRFPAVAIAADNALSKTASVDRSEILDFDRATTNQLDRAGLGRIEALASTPTKLVSSILGQSESYSRSLITDTQTTLQADFRNGYLGYAGITKAQSDNLKKQFPSAANLANVSPNDLASTLGNTSYSNRFLADVRNTLPSSTYSLDSVGISPQGRSALEEFGVTTNRRLLDEAAREGGRDRLREALNVPDATLDRYLDNAALNLAIGTLNAAPNQSIGTLVGVSDEVKANLANSGIASVKELANANPEALASVLGISSLETAAIVDAAAAVAPNVHVSLLESITQGAVSSEQIANAGLNSAAAIAQANVTTLEGLGLDANQAQKAIAINNQLLQSGAFSSGLIGRLR
jgi:hypothetical protein